MSLFLSLPAISLGIDSEYHKEVLDNGATVVVRRIPESGLVTVQIRVMSGLSNEGEYAGSGISHFLEHLLFKGTRNMGAEDLRGKIKAMGGMVNGSTGLDSAEYHITVPNDRFAEALDLMADMVMEPVFTAEDFEKEKEVILKEIRLRNDDPSTKRIRLLFSTAYTDNVYRYPIIGYEDLLKGVTMDDVARYHAAVYRPDRVVVGIAGGVAPDEALAAAREKFGAYERALPWQPQIYAEPRQIEERSADIRADVALGYLSVGFHTTSLYSEDLYASDVLSMLLGGGSDSRLFRRLVKEKELLYTVGSLNYTPKYPGLFMVTGAGEPDKLEEAVGEIFAVIEEVSRTKVRPREMERVKNLVVSEYLRSHERVESVVSSMTSSELLTGDPEFFEKYVKRIREVNPGDMADIAAKYLTRDNSTVIRVLPFGFSGQEAADEKERGGKSESTEEAPDVKSVDLDNGMRIIVKRRPSLPLVAVTYAAPGGLRAEDRANNGISNLTTSLTLKGTRRRREEDITPAVERMGGSIRAFSGMNSLGLSMSLMSGDLDRGMDIFEDVLKDADFPEKEIRKQKKKIRAAIRAQEKDIFENGMLHLQKMLYGKHPYSMRILGEAPVVETLSREEIEAFYRKHFVPGGSVLTVVGDVDVEGTIRDLARRFSRWQGAATAIFDRKVEPLTDLQRADILMRKEQSLVLMGFQNVRIKDDRKYALSVLSSVLSGADGLLFHTLREREGITYASGAVSVPQVDPGYFVLYVATTEENVEKAKSGLIAVLEKVRKGDISDEEIAASKSRLISQHARSLQTNSSFAMTMSLDDLYGLGKNNYEKFPGEIKAVTREEMTRAADEILDPRKAAILVVHSAGE